MDAPTFAAAGEISPIARDGAVGKGERAEIVDAPTTVEKCNIVRNGTVGEGERALVVDEAFEPDCAVFEDQVGNGDGESLHHMHSVPTLATAYREGMCHWTTDRQVPGDVQFARQHDGPR